MKFQTYEVTMEIQDIQKIFKEIKDPESLETLFKIYKDAKPEVITPDLRKYVTIRHLCNDLYCQTYNTISISFLDTYLLEAKGEKGVTFPCGKLVDFKEIRKLLFDYLAKKKKFFKQIEQLNEIQRNKKIKEFFNDIQTFYITVDEEGKNYDNKH